MNNTNFTDNNNSIGNITIDAVTGEVIENTMQATAADNFTIHGNEPKAADIPDSRDLKKPKQLFFNAREWKPSKECDKTVATRSFISDPFGGFTEAYTVGDWSWNWSQIETKDMVLEKNTDYEFIFWLNGGENDQSQEICRLEIMFDNNHEDRYIYNLNRNFIKYVRHYKGWYLFSIPFNTGDAAYTKFRFVAQRAYSTLMKAEPVESYENLPEDNAPEGVPQRHNIVFSEGFPRNSWWSYMVFPDLQNKNDDNKSEQKRVIHINGKGLSDLDGLSELSDLVRERIEEELEGELDPDVLAEELMDEIDVDSIKERIIQQIRDSL